MAALFTLARFSEAFLILKVADVGLGFGYVPAVLVVMNVAYALSAYPAGWLSDRVNRWGVFAVGAALLIAADLVLAFGSSIALVGVGIALWGLHMGFTQGLLAALVADAREPSSAAPRSACSTSSRASRCSRPACSPACSGIAAARSSRSSRARR